MSSLISQLGNCASWAVGNLFSYGSYAAFKGISLTGTALQIGADYGAENAPKVAAYAGEKLKEGFQYAAPKALTGLQYYVAPVVKQYGPHMLAVVGAIIGLKICIRMIKAADIKGKVVYIGKSLEPVIRYGVIAIGVAAFYKVAPSLITTQSVAAAGLAACTGIAMHARTPRYRVYAMIGVALTAHFLLK